MFSRIKMELCLFAVIFAGALGSNLAPAWALQDLREGKSPWIADEIPGNPVGYCHMKFPAIDEKTLGADEPRLERPEEGNMVDFYGPCDHDPLGAEEVRSQLHEQELERSRQGAED